jgi:hypothetical protein
MKKQKTKTKSKSNSTKANSKIHHKKIMIKRKTPSKQIKTVTKRLKKQQKKISKKDFLFEILQEYNLSKDVDTFEKNVKRLVSHVEAKSQKAHEFKTLFSKCLTKAYIKSKLTYEFTPKDLKFIKEIINKALPCQSPTKSCPIKKELIPPELKPLIKLNSW